MAKNRNSPLQGLAYSLQESHFADWHAKADSFVFTKRSGVNDRAALDFSNLFATENSTERCIFSAIPLGLVAALNFFAQKCDFSRRRLAFISSLHFSVQGIIWWLGWRKINFFAILRPFFAISAHFFLKGNEAIFKWGISLY